MNPQTNASNKKPKKDNSSSRTRRLSFMAIQEKLGLFLDRQPRVDPKPIASAAKDKKPLSYL